MRTKLFLASVYKYLPCTGNTVVFFEDVFLDPCRLLTKYPSHGYLTSVSVCKIGWKIVKPLFFFVFLLLLKVDSSLMQSILITDFHTHICPSSPDPSSYPDPLPSLEKNTGF